MNRVLIVAGERATGERLQRALGESGYQTAVVWNSMQMVEFCRQHEPDFLIADLDLAEYGLWSAVQAVKAMGMLANIPFFGLSSVMNPQLIEKAMEAGFSKVFLTHEGTQLIIEELSSTSLSLAGSEIPETDDIVSRDPSLNKLREIVRDIVTTTQKLKAFLPEFGEDGPELFGYIESAGVEIRKRLNAVEDFSLSDKELRHDFRNLIGSVTGFAELIAMEPTISPTSSQGMAHLRNCSREFVEVLDEQKASAGA